MAELSVAQSDHLPEVLAKLRSLRGQDVTLTVPISAPVLLTASEFRALATAAEGQGSTLTIETGDPLRRQLAQMFGVQVGELPLVLESHHEPVLALGEHAVESDVQTEIDEVETEESLEVPVGRGRRKWLLAALGGLVGVALLAYLLAPRFLLEADVTVELARIPVTAELQATTNPDNPAEIQVEGEQLLFDLTTTLTKAVTGVETIGATAASGDITLRNTSGSAIDMAKGTLVTSFDGVAFETTEDVTVPAADDNGAQPGETSVGITALDLGAAGNLDVGMLTGRLENGLFFSNRNAALAGGDDEEVAVVSQEDIDALRSSAIEAMTQRAQNEMIGGQIIIPSSVAGDDGDFVFDHAVGDEAESIAVDATMSFTAQAIDPAVLEAAAVETLQANVQPGWELEPESISYSAATQSDGVVSVSVMADARPIIDDTWLAEVAENLAGLDEEGAAAYLANREDISTFELQTSPDWLSSNMPESKDNIEILVR